MVAPKQRKKEVGTIAAQEPRLNEAIRVKECRLIGYDGSQLGIYPIEQAQRIADDEGYDLVEIAPQAKPPVCKIIDYGRYRFEQQKKEREAKKNQQTAEMKSLRVSPVIDQHDFDTKVKRAKEWLSDGQKVKIDMRFRGRMITRQEVGKQVLDKFTEQVSDVADVTKPPMLEGNTMSVTFSPKKGK